MCNSKNHSFGCQCGFGGEGHLGRRGGAVNASKRDYPAFYSAERSRRWHNKPMSVLAAELGYSLLFPVRCRYCEAHIFLFANPNGAFAMFDDNRWPWPRHRCFGVSADPRDYRIPALPYSPRYEIPVPASARFMEFNSGEEIGGTVVEAKEVESPRPLGKVYQIVLYNGRSLFQVHVRIVLRIGLMVQGRAIFVPGIGTCLSKIEQTDGQVGFEWGEANPR